VLDLALSASPSGPIAGLWRGAYPVQDRTLRRDQWSPPTINSTYSWNRANRKRNPRPRRDRRLDGDEGSSRLLSERRRTSAPQAQQVRHAEASGRERPPQPSAPGQLGQRRERRLLEALDVDEVRVDEAYPFEV
jgi:hypothetical protein